MLLETDKDPVIKIAASVATNKLLLFEGWLPLPIIKRSLLDPLKLYVPTTT